MSGPSSNGRVSGPVLDVRHLSVNYRDRRGGYVAALSDVSFSVRSGEIFGLVGETGSGKSTVLRAIIGLLHPSARVAGGVIRVHGEDVVAATPRQLERLRNRHMAMVFQDPLRSLNPVLSVEDQIGEALAERERLPRHALRERVLETMRIVGIGDAERRLRAYPHELSGGLRQRVAIAAAVIRSPDLLLADEPTTALDVSIQDQILTLLLDLCRTLGTSVVLVTHDIGVVAEVCQRVGVMYAGRLVELGAVAQVLAAPGHPYTAALLGSIPRIGGRKTRLAAIPGAPPDLSEVISGCPFAPRCAYVEDRCLSVRPGLEVHSVDQLSACVRHAELGRQLVGAVG